MPLAALLVLPLSSLLLTAMPAAGAQEPAATVDPVAPVQAVEDPVEPVQVEPVQAVQVQAVQVQADADGLTYQQALQDWWSGAGNIWLGDTAYRIQEPVTLADGVCQARMDDGMLIPVWAGKAPVSERIVGFVFMGTGALEVEIPLRADRWRLANQAARYHLFSPEIQAAIAHAQQPLRAGLERGLVLSADPKVRDLLAGLEPVGGGSMIRTTGDEQGDIDEAYVITARRGLIKLKAVATNLLPQRRLQMQRAGLDPRVWLRQDRLQHDELGVDGGALRLVADWRTDLPLHVAAELGAGVGNNDYDRWITCFRDPLDQEGLGFDSMAFAGGTDPEGKRHFERISGQPALPTTQRPGAWMEGTDADVTVTSRPKGMGNQRYVDVDSVLSLTAVGGSVRSVTLSMPVNGSVRGSWRLDELSLEDGTPLARVGLTEDLFGHGSVARADGAQEDQADETTSDNSPEAVSNTADTQPSTNPTQTASGTTSVPRPSGLGGGQGTTSNQVAGPSLEPTTSTSLDAPESIVSGAEGRAGLSTGLETELVKDAPLEHFVQVILPHDVAEGETIKLRVHWEARWPFANWSSEGRSLGSTTGLQGVVPQPVPSPAGARWHSRIRVGVPAAGLSEVDVAVTGETVREWNEDTWSWIEAESHGAAAPAVAIGRWSTQVDPPGKGMPGVRVHLFSRDAWALPEFPPEVRRVLAFLERFLPDLPMKELEVYQGASGFVSSVLQGDPPEGGNGLVEVATIKTSSVTDQAQVDDVDPYLTQALMARQVAAQYWGQEIAPQSERDAWLLPALADAYAAFYVRAAFGNDAYADRMGKLRKLVEDPTEYQANQGQVNRAHRFLSLTGATPASDVPEGMRREYGAYLVADVLRLRLGDQVYFAALDRLARARMGRAVTTEALQAALEEGSGQDLDDLFDWAVHGGFVPDLTVEVAQEADGSGGTIVHGCVVSSVPWGRFDVPIEVIDRAGKRSVSALVQVVDGLGPFEVPARDGDVDVKLDPLGMTVAYSRRVQRVQQTRCPAAASEAPETAP